MVNFSEYTVRVTPLERDENLAQVAYQSVGSVSAADLAALPDDLLNTVDALQGYAQWAKTEGAKAKVEERGLCFKRMSPQLEVLNDVLPAKKNGAGGVSTGPKK